MLTLKNLTKALTLSIFAGFSVLAIRVLSATRITNYDPNINWETVNAMSYAEATQYLQEHTIVVSGISVFAEYIENPIYLWGKLGSVLYWSLGFFVCFVILLLWVAEKSNLTK